MSPHTDRVTHNEQYKTYTVAFLGVIPEGITAKDPSSQFAAMIGTVAHRTNALPMSPAEFDAFMTKASPPLTPDASGVQGDTMTWTPSTRGVTAATSDVPEFVCMERAAALWSLLTEIECTGGWPKEAGYAAYEGLLAAIQTIVKRREEYFSEGHDPSDVTKRRLYIRAGMSLSPVGRMHEREMVIATRLAAGAAPVK